MKEKYFSSKFIILIIILFTCIFIFSTTSLALIPGDFGSANNGPPDGVVDFEDLMIFALAYGSIPADSNWNVLCDIASQGGVIQPDGIIDFEDLMIFAMHYGECECIPPSAPILSDPGIWVVSGATYTVSWSAVTGATSYVLQEATSSDFTSGLQEYPVTGTSESFSHTVSTTTTYYYRVASVNSCGQGSWSNIVDIQICPCTPPSAPTLFDPGIWVVSGATYTVSWPAVTTATSYVLQEATSSDFTSGLQEYPLTDTSESFSHTVSATTTYYYRVAAINDCGQGDWSNVEYIIINCILPSAPILSDPGISLPSPATYMLSWTPVTGATSYVLQEATSSDFTSGLQEYPLTDTSESFSHTVTTTTTYYYRVAAINDCGQSGWSNVKGIDIVTCSSPPVTEVTALGFTYHSSYMSVVQSIINKLIKENRIHESYPIIPKKIERMDVVYEIYIEWAEYTEDKPNGYKVYKSIDGGSYQLIVEGDADAGYGYYSFTDTTVTEGSTYSYYITAYGSGWETCSSELAITTVLPWCSLVSPLDGVTIKNNPNPDFSWSSVNISSYPYGAISYGDSDLRVKDTTTGGESWYILFNNMTLSTTTYDKDGQAIPLISGHSYTWNSCGYGYDEKSGNLIAVSCSEDWGFDYCTAPSPPTLFNPGDTLPSSATYTVSWSSVSGAKGYVLQEDKSSSFSGAQEYTLGGTSKEFSHTVSTTTTYYYRVASVNSCGQGGWSNVKNITIVIVIDPVHNLTKNTYYDTIQESLDDADSLGGDTIEADDGTYNESITFPAGKLVTLQSASGIRDNVIIRGVNNLSIVTINGSATGTTLSGFTITHTGGDTGRGIHINSGNLIVDNCTISGNTADWGGGICNYYGTLTITSSTISGNTADWYGTGIYSSGGGIYNEGGTLNITSSTISSNTAGSGGGIFNYGTLITITESNISDNTATDYGGGIYNDDGTLTITSSDISGNTASHGGGIHNRGTFRLLNITSSTISGNTAADYGGGIHNHGGTIDITSSTISSNTASYGGGITNEGLLTIQGGSTISDNTAASHWRRNT